MRLRRNIAMHDEKGEKRFLAIGLTSLGLVLLQASRFDEAQICFERSMRHYPKRASGCRSMADLSLRRGDERSEAVGWAKQAIAREQADRQLSADVIKLNLGEDLATLAWPTAADSHNAPAVARLVDEVRSVGVSNVQSTAQVHCLSARAFAELGDAAASARHYRDAAMLDLQGHGGRAARAALQASADRE